MPKIYNLQLNYGCLFQTKCTQKCFWNCGHSKFLHTFYMIFFFKGSCSNEVALAAWSKELTKDRSEVKEVINGWVMTSQVCEQLSAGQYFSNTHLFYRLFKRQHFTCFQTSLVPETWIHLPGCPDPSWRICCLHQASKWSHQRWSVTRISSTS